MDQSAYPDSLFSGHFEVVSVTATLGRRISLYCIATPYRLAKSSILENSQSGSLVALFWLFDQLIVCSVLRH